MGQAFHEERRLRPSRMNDEAGSLLARRYGDLELLEVRKALQEKDREVQALGAQLDRDRKSLREKEGLLKEVHHRVKNSLQVVTSLLRLEAGRSDQAATRVALKEMQGRILAMSLLHETLYQSGSFGRIELADYLRRLATQLCRLHNTEPRAVELTLELAPARVEIDRAIPCGLIVNELVTNGLKYAFADGRRAEIKVSLSWDPDGSLRLQVADNGVGLPPDFDLKRSPSLGLPLVSDLAGQLGGGLQIGPGPGATFVVRFQPGGPQPEGTGKPSL